MSTIYLFRHGQASFGKSNYDKLSDLGCEQATALGNFLADSDIIFDAAYAGSLQRQQKTAQLALALQPDTVELIIDKRFNEINNDEQIRYLLPILAKQNDQIKQLVDGGLNNSKQFQKAIEAVFNFWVSDNSPDMSIQTWQDYSTNAIAAFNAVQTEQGSGKTVAIFTSGGTIATLVAYVLGLKGTQTYQFYEPVINCSLTEIFYNQRKCSLSCFNDYSYLTQTNKSLVTYR